MTQLHPAPIADVTPGSVGDRCGLRPGDNLLMINGLPLRDTIDVRIYSSEPELYLIFERAGEQQSCEIQRRYGEPLGLDFSKELFVGEPRVCRNRCEFCFVSQMPVGMRRSLYIKDDDYRLSFLHGNYITLTNLTDADWHRIQEQFLSPLYISVHATEPETRADLMRNPRAGQILDQLQTLAESGIEMHTQAVLVPGRNDGAHLDRTVADLAALYPAVQDLSVVPVGLTRDHAPDLRVYTDAEVGVVLDRVLDWQARLREALGVGFVYPSDEWFMRSEAALPEAGAYDGLLPAMIENGVGMVRRFRDNRAALQAALVGLGRHQTWVTGTLFAAELATFARSVAAASNIRIEVVPVVNAFFGPTVTVAGLLTVADMIPALAARELGDAIVLPLEAFRGPEGQSLDGAQPASVQAVAGCEVYLAGWDDPHGWTIQPAVA